MLWGAALMPRSWLYKLQYPAIFLSLFLLLLTLSPLTPSINGAKRWIPLGPVNLQPMEFVKISLALYLAYFMSSKQALVKTFSRGVIPPFAVTGLFCGLLLLQPDFGSAVVVASILFFMCLAGGTRFIYLFFAMILACAGAMALAILEPYRLRRLLAFLDPFADPTDTGYHLVQSLLAIGSGGLFGVGLGQGTPEKIPAYYNDFIFAVVCEQLGQAFGVLLLAVYVLLILRGVTVVARARRSFEMLLGCGVLAMLGVIACPITSGDTAFRSARLVLADWFKLDQKKWKNRLLLCVPVLGVGAILGVGNALGAIDYTIIWRYFSWTNQTLAMIVLWAASMYLFYDKKNYWLTAVPATFMSAVSATYFLLGNECLGQLINHKAADGTIIYNTAVAYPVGIAVAALFLGIFLYTIKKRHTQPHYETLGK